MKTFITVEMAESCYKTAKSIFPDKEKIEKSAEKISKQTKMNKNSVKDYLKVFFNMMNAEKLQHDISERDTRYYLENIQKDFGNEKLQNALYSLQEYLNNENQNHPGLQKIHDEFKNRKEFEF